MNLTAAETAAWLILERATVKIDNNNLIVSTPGGLPAEVASAIKRHKAVLIKWFKAQSRR